MLSAFSCCDNRLVNLFVRQIQLVCGFDPICNGWADDNPTMSWRPGLWEPEGLIDCAGLLLAFPNSYYKKVYEGDYTPTTMGMMELQPMSDDNHFEHIAQAHPDLYRTQAAEVALWVLPCMPLLFS